MMMPRDYPDVVDAEFTEILEPKSLSAPDQPGSELERMRRRRARDCGPR